MDMYVYAPKDDYKHRAYWRELYTVEEAEHLTSLISAAKEQGIVFCYALSPGLDISYSSQKEITILKRKLEQVSFKLSIQIRVLTLGFPVSIVSVTMGTIVQYLARVVWTLDSLLGGLTMFCN